MCLQSSMALFMGYWILLVFQRVAGYDLVCTIYIRGMSRDYMCVIKGMCRQATFTSHQDMIFLLVYNPSNYVTGNGSKEL